MEACVSYRLPLSLPLHSFQRPPKSLAKVSALRSHDRGGVPRLVPSAIFKFPITSTDKSGITTLENLTYHIRQVEIDEFWDLAHTHSISFHPELKFPFSAMLRADRVLAYVGNLVPSAESCRTNLVAVIGNKAESSDSTNSPEVEKLSLFLDFRPLALALGAITFWPFSGFWLKNRVLGCVTVDNAAEFLLRYKHDGSKRKNHAYISNMAVLNKYRRNGIAMNLIQEAEEMAREWGCKFVALHCDVNNVSSLSLYKKAGYRLIQEPHGASWPKPPELDGAKLRLMLKRL